MNEPYDHESRMPERRRNPSLSEAQLSLVVEEEVERRLAKVEGRMMAHMDVKFDQLHKLITDAFPGGDPHEHRMHHEKSIRDADAWSRIKGDVLSKFLTSGLWVAAGYLLFLIWSAIKEGVRQ